MNRKQFIILLVLVVVIGGAGLLVRQRNSNSWQGNSAGIGQKLLPNLPVNDVAEIVIKSGTNELDLARQDNLWRVRERANYPANFSQISDLLVKLADLKVVQDEEFGPSQLGRFELLPPGSAPNTGTSLDLKDGTGKTLGALLLGKKHMHKPPTGNSQPGGMGGDEGWPDGRYVMAGAGASSVAVISDPLDNVQPKADQWLSKDFLSVEKPKSISAEFPIATNSWKLTRASETNDWELADAKPGEKLDSSKISSVTSPFSSPSFNDVAPLSTGSAAGNTVVTIETFDGFTYTSTIRPKDGDNYPVSFAISASLPSSRTPAKDEKPADKAKLDKEFQAQQKTLADKLAKEQTLTNWLFEMPSYSIDELLKTRQQLLVETSTNATTQAAK
jgi:hypothetical protein